MTATFATRRTLRTASQFIATLALAVSLVACGDSVSGPTSNPGGTTGTGSTGTGSSTATNSITVSKSGYKDLRLDATKGFSEFVNDTTAIYFEGNASDGTAFALLMTVGGTGSGRYNWNDASGTATMFLIGNETHLGISGETTITSVDKAAGRMKGTFNGTIASKKNPSTTFGFRGTFDLPITK